MTTSSYTRRNGPTLFVGLIAMVFAQVDGRAQTVVNRARIGGYAEDIALVTSGPFRNNLVLIAGYDLSRPSGQRNLSNQWSNSSN